MLAARVRLFFFSKSSRAGSVGARQVLCAKQSSQRSMLSTRTASYRNTPQSTLQTTTSSKYLYLSSRHIQSTALLWSDVSTVSTPPFAESITEGDVKWEKEVGDYVEADEVIAEIETDKTAIPVLSPIAGIIDEIMVPDGDKVIANTELCKIKASGDSPKPVSTTQAEVPSAPKPVQPSQPVPATGSPIPTIPPPVPSLPDKPFAESPRVPSTLPSRSSIDVKDVIAGSRTEKRVKVNRMRQRIAQRLKEAQNTNAMLTTFNEVDMSNVIEMRNAHKDLFLKKHGIKLGFMSPFVRAAAFALQDQPIVNAVIDGGDIVYRDYVDISVAVATPKGLVVPVLRNVESMNYADIEKEVNEMGVKARDGTLAIEDMDGGTFTISNGGVFGSMFGTPIINPPQSAILGMHATLQRPVAIDGKVEIRPMMYVALTYDHRLIDGREAVLFLKKIKSAVEDPRVMLLDV